MKNLCKFTDEEGIYLKVARIDYQQKNLENYIEIRVKDGNSVIIPEKKFNQICEWFLETQKTGATYG